MIMYLKQKIFSLMDSFEVYDAQGNTIYNVKSKLSLGHCLKIYNTYGTEVGFVKRRILSLMPRFEVYYHNNYLGHITRELTLFRPKYDIEYNGWHVEGDIFEWNYRITCWGRGTIATISKQLFHLTDHYMIDVADPQDAPMALMFVLAIDAEKCARRD